MISCPVVASSVLSPFPEPTRNPPPWICTITGSPAADVVPGGRQTLTNRQFWLPVSGRGEAAVGLAGWVHSLPNVVACSLAVHGACGCGGCQRSAPTGGAAYGMPSHSLTPLTTIPQIGPVLDWTFVPDPQPACAETERADVLACTPAPAPTARAAAASTAPVARYFRRRDRTGLIARLPSKWGRPWAGWGLPAVPADCAVLCRPGARGAGPAGLRRARPAPRRVRGRPARSRMERRPAGSGGRPCCSPRPRPRRTRRPPR